MFQGAFRLWLFVLGLTLLSTTEASACVGRFLYVGTLNTVEDTVLSEILVLLINERTGTTVKIRSFETNDLLYQALKSTDEEQRVDIIVEDTADALAVAKQPASGNPGNDFALVKEFYDKNLDIVWLSPFGYTNSKGQTGQTMSAPLVRRDVLTNFPLLPRVLGKLAGAVDDETFARLVQSAKAGEKPKNVARDFLRSKKLI